MTDHEKLREAIRSLRHGTNHTNIEWRDLTKMVCDAAESTLPKTKMVEVWRVEWSYKTHTGWHPNSSRPFLTREEAECFQRHNVVDKEVLCLRITGPHQQEVPA